ncbi:hypothetical protein ZWY2020_027998 [Hordeum vulgare]|nr:hypothetical protein ZWY2020_027998 [Hordeum vulgare]
MMLMCTLLVLLDDLIWLGRFSCIRKSLGSSVVSGVWGGVTGTIERGVTPQGVYMKRENAGSWNSGLEKEQILETYSAQLQKS